MSPHNLGQSCRYRLAHNTFASDISPLSKKLKAHDNEYATDEDDEPEDTALVKLSEEALTFFCKRRSEVG